MRQQIIILIFFLGVGTTLTAQKEDNVWIFGYTSTPIGPGSDRINFIFNDSLEIEYTHGGMQLWRSYASICDSSGQLLLLSNGCYIEDEQMEYVNNSSGLNPGYVYDNSCIKDSFGYSSSNTMFFVKDASNINQYKLFHMSTYFSVQPLVGFYD